MTTARPYWVGCLCIASSLLVGMGSPGCGDDEKAGDTADSAALPDAETSAGDSAPDGAPDDSDAQGPDVVDTDEVGETDDVPDVPDVSDVSDTDDVADVVDTDDLPDTEDAADSSETVETVDTTVHLRMQAGFPVLPASADSSLASALELLLVPFERWAERVDTLSGGALKIDIVPCCAAAAADSVHEAVSNGAVLDGAQGIAAYLYNTSSRLRRAAGLFDGGFSELDSEAMLAWMVTGGGQQLYDELMHALGYDLVVIPFGALPSQNLGWFPFELSTPEELVGMKYRTAGISNEMAAALGMTPTSAGAGVLVAALGEGTLDAAEFNSPAADLGLGLHAAVQPGPCAPDGDCRFVYHLGGLGQVAEWFDLIINRAAYDALTPEHQQILRDAARLESPDLAARFALADAEALAILREHVEVVDVPDSIVRAQRAAWNEVIDCPAADPEDLFCRVAASIRAYAQSVQLVTTVSGFSRPESAFAHEGAWYVSNIGLPDAGVIDGFISKLAPDGTTLELQWRTGLASPKGLRISDEDLLYVGDEGGLAVIDLDGSTVGKIAVPGAVFPNDVTIDGAGDIYLSDTGTSQVWRVPRGSGERAAFLARVAAGAVTPVLFFPTEAVSDPDFVGPNGLAVDGDMLVISAYGYTLPVSAGQSAPVVPGRLFRVPLAGGAHEDSGPLAVDGPDADLEPEVLRGLDGLETLGADCYLGTANAQGWLVRVCLAGGAAHVGFLGDVGLRAANMGIAGPLYAHRIVAVPHLDRNIVDLWRLPPTRAESCDPAMFPANLVAGQQCCRYGTQTWHKNGNPGPNFGKVARRMFGPACRMADGTSGCSGGPPFPRCTYGPCGFTIVSALGNAESVVFHPESLPDECGWQATQTDATGTWYPEPYLDQELYEGVTGTCPFNGCLLDGTAVTSAVYLLEVTAVAETASGSVASEPAGITLSGAGKTAWIYQDGATITVTATPTGADARAIFSGDCSADGAYGAAASCQVSLVANKALTVTFECRADAVCGP